MSAPGSLLDCSSSASGEALSLPRGFGLEFVFVCCSCVVFQVLPCRAQDLPVDLLHVRQRAEEHYFDGEYEDAKRVLAEAEKWLDSPLNKRDLIRLNIDHSMLDVFFSAFRAEVLFAMGENVPAQGALRHAEKILRNRRNRLAAAGAVPPLMLQYEAFIEFVRGDLLQPIPDFGISEDTEMPDEVRQLFLESKPEQALAAYKRAETVLGNPAADDGGGFFQRLEGRLLTSLARCRILKVGTPTGTDVADCEALLDRAEAVFQKGAFWQQVINQQNTGRLPMTFKAVNEQTDPSQRLGLKRRFAQTISDWVEIELLRAELTAYQEQDEAEDQEVIDTAERGYDEVVGFLKSQFGGEHACVQRAQLSRARWLVALAGGSDLKAETRVSYLQDCLSDLSNIKNVAAQRVTQLQALELAASTKMIAANEGLERLEPDQISRLKARIEELKKLLAARMAR